ncbi:alpha/beta hydrolase family protein [Parablastomonas sp. CN1-191]|uniref:alpha/beta hydrolase family protein n=1 Tax=Parablastomonas sp. CN1-191 TaxID=3400908 RepID=UPI003BF8B1C4
MSIAKTVRAAVLAGVAVIAIPAAAQTPPSHQIAAKIPLDTLVELPSMQQLRLSPDGTKAAVTLGGGNDFVYAVLDLVNGGKPKVIASAETYKDAGQRTLAGYRWANDRYLLLTLTSREIVYGQRVDLRRLASYDIVTGKTTPLAWDGATADAADVLHIDKKNGRILLARQVDNGNTEQMFNYRVEWVDVATGKVLSVVQQPNPIVGGWFADGNGVVRMGTAGDRDTGEERYLYRSGEGQAFTTVQRVKDKDFSGAGIRPIVFLDEPDMAIVSSNHEGHRAIYKANLKTMTIVSKVFEAPAGYDASSAIANEDENGVVGYTFATDRDYVSFTDNRLKTIQAFLEDSYGKGNAQIVSTNDGDHRLIVALGKPEQENGYYLYDADSGKMQLIGWQSAKLKDGLLNPVSAFRYTASDGLPIEAVVTRPRLRAGQKNLPVVVLTHGGPYGVRDYVEADQWAQSIAEQGYVVVQPNYRGSGGYGVEFGKAGRKDGFGTRMQDDLNDAVDALAAQGIVDKSRACMMGWSYGGYASARAAQRDPQRWRCTIAGAGVYDLPAMRDYDKGYLGSFGANYLAKGAASLDQVSPARNAGGEWSKILIVHGVRDPRVPIAQARALRSALKGAGKKEGVDFAYIEQPKNGHYGIYFTKEERLEWLGGASAWLDRYNPAYVAADADFAAKPAIDPAVAAMGQRLFARTSG